MDPITHWNDIDFDPGLMQLSQIVFVIGAVYFAYSYWRLKRRRAKSDRSGAGDPPALTPDAASESN